MEAMWDTRGYTGILLSFDNGYPYTVGKDVFVGGLASMATTQFQYVPQSGSSSGNAYNLYTDYVERISIKDSPTERMKAEVMIGDGKSHDNPVIKVQRTIAKFEEAFQIVTLSQ